MFCSYCGAQLPDGAAFCSHCGKPVAAPVPEPVVEAVEEIAAPVVETVEEIAAPVVEAVEEVAAPVVEAVEEAPEAVSADVEDALARLRAEMEAAGELPASSPAEPVVEAVEPEVAAPVFEAAAPAVAEVAPVVPVAPAAEPASYVEPTPAPAPAPEPQPAYTPAPQQSYTPAPQPAYTPAPQQSYTPQTPAQSYTPQPTQAYTQPTQAYTQPTQSYTPPAPTGQPAQSYSYQPAATSVAGAKPAKKSPIAKIAIGVIALALVGFIVFTLFGGGGKKPSGGSSSGGGSSTPVVTPTDNGGDSGSSTTPSTPAPSSDYATVDSKANPTFYTMLATDGGQLIDVIETEGGFSWKSDNLWWLSPDGNDAFYVMGKDDYEFTRTEIRNLPANGKGTPCVFVLVVDDRDYSSMSDVVDKLCNISLDDSVFVDDEGIGMALVTTPSGETDLVVVTYIEDPGLYRVNIFNEDAIAAGVFEDAFDIEGSTATEVWHNIMD